MATDFELALFEEELNAVRSLPEASRWELERDDSVPLGLKVIMHPINQPTELFQARIRWADYFQPPSLKFLNRDTGSDADPTAWPQCQGFRHSALDACVSWTAEGHSLHAEWAASPRAAFSKPEAPMQFVLLILQRALDTTFCGRGTP